MNSEPIEPIAIVRSEDDIVRALMLLHGISTTVLERIRDLMRDHHIEFSEAALQSGEVTQKQLDETYDWISSKGQSGPGLVEQVLRRTSQRRQPILSQHDQLQPDARLVIAHQADHLHSERIRSLRTELLLRTKGQRRAKVIAILSAARCEGRSQLAAEVTIAFAQLGRSAILVDCDLRRPSQHGLFGAENDAGLAQALAEGRPQYLLHGIRDLPHMSLLTSGALPSNPLELLTGVPFERILGTLQSHFEFVILDTPPVLEFSDGLVIAAAAKNALLLGRANITKFAEMGELCRKLSSTGSRILGAVINRF